MNEGLKCAFTGVLMCLNSPSFKDHFKYRPLNRHYTDEALKRFLRGGFEFL